MIRVPARLIDRSRLDAFLGEVECATLEVSGENRILDIERGEIASEEWDDGSGWLAALAPLRAEVLAGDLRLFYLLWLTAVEADVFEAEEPEPLPGIGPVSAALESFATSFGSDPDLVQAAGERPAPGTAVDLSAAMVREIVSAMSDLDKTAILPRLFDGDPHIGAELRAEVTRRAAANCGDAPLYTARTVGELRARAEAIGVARTQAAAEQAAAAKARRVAEAEATRQARLLAIARRGEAVWREVEDEIERGHSAAYDKAAGLLADLQAVARERGTEADFRRRLRAIRERHARKQRFIERLTASGMA